MSGRTLARRFGANWAWACAPGGVACGCSGRSSCWAAGVGVTRTAMELGYGSTSAFVYAFRTDGGCSPQAYMRGRVATAPPHHPGLSPRLDRGPRKPVTKRGAQPPWPHGRAAERQRGRGGLGLYTTTCGGFSPLKNASRLSSAEAHPVARLDRGAPEVREQAQLRALQRSPGLRAGSFANTSRPAANRRPERRAASRALSSTSVPRAVLTTTAPSGSRPISARSRGAASPPRPGREREELAACQE